MTLDEAIAHADEVAASTCGVCADQHNQLARWLRELRHLRNTKAAQAEPAEVLYDERAMLEIFEAARAGSDKPAGIIRGIRAVIASWEERSDAGLEDYAMNQEIIAMAREAGFVRAGSSGHLIFNDELERFATLVAAKEREKCAQVCENFNPEHKDCNYYDKAMAAAIRARSTNA